MDYVVFNDDMYSEGKLLFKKGKSYEIVSEIDDDYAIKYDYNKEAKRPICCLFPKSCKGIEFVCKEDNS
jgi:hypothetical protein